MNRFDRPQLSTLDFQFEAKPPLKALEKMAFIYLLSAKFNGKIKVSNFDEGQMLDVRLRLPGYPEYSDARSHCISHLTECGEVMPTYVKALESADPRLRQSKELLRQVGVEI